MKFYLLIYLLKSFYKIAMILKQVIPVSRDPVTNDLRGDLDRFPSGMKKLADYVSSRRYNCSPNNQLI